MPWDDLEEHLAEAFGPGVLDTHHLPRLGLRTIARGPRLTAEAATHCTCGARLPPRLGKPRRWCSESCRNAARRALAARRRLETPAPPPPAAACRCGALLPAGGRRRWCSEACRRGAPPAAPRTCAGPGCGVVFVPRAPEAVAIYCCRECKKRAARARARAEGRRVT